MKLIELLSAPVAEEQKKRLNKKLPSVKENEEVAGVLPAHLQDLMVRIDIMVDEAATEQEKLLQKADEMSKKDEIAAGWLKKKVDIARSLFWRAVEEELGLAGESLAIRTDWVVCFNGSFCPGCGIHHKDEEDMGDMLASILFGGGYQKV